MTLPLVFYPAALVSACLFSAATLPFWRRWCCRVGLVDEPGDRKIHSEPIPLAGGLAVFTGIVLPILFAGLLLLCTGKVSSLPPHGAPGSASVSNHITSSIPAGSANDSSKDFMSYLGYGFNRRLVEVLGICLGAIGMLAIGFLDDQHELKPRAKFVGQLLVALLVAACGVRITLFIPNILFSYVVTVLWILTLINAFNFMDNMNGLCAGLGTIAAAVFGMLAAAQDQYLVGLIAFLTAGALLGFMPYNFPRAKAFLGDAGSHLVGYLMAILAVLPHFYTQKHPRRIAVLIPLFVLATPLIDMVWVVLIRWRTGRPFYQGDTNHISHRLVRLGLSKTSAVIVIWVAAALISSLVLFF
jgi:UDP-GlcNAc:undecaprenyl-phosphate GlcNAc-1-phosphate transferase